MGVVEIYQEGIRNYIAILFSLLIILLPVSTALEVKVTDRNGIDNGDFKVNKIIDKKFHLTISKGNNHITIKKTPSLLISAKIDRIQSNQRLVTDVVAVEEEIEFESATLVLQKTRPVKEILHCPDFNYDKFTCPEWESTDIPFIEEMDMVTFSVPHFSAYAGGSTNSQLYIWDTRDEGSYPVENEVVYFYANYTNATTNGSISGASCQVRFNETGSWESYNDMTNSSGKYEYNRSFTEARTYSWNVLCNATSQGYDILNATDEIEIIVNNTYDGAYTSKHDLTYDANGNLIQGKDNYYEYNSLNQLIRVRNGSAEGSTIEEYAYDENGERIYKIEYFGDGTNQTTFYWDEDYIEVVNSSGTFSFTYYHDTDGNLLGRKDPDGKKYYYHPDHLGSTTLITNESGEVVEETRYLPFGAVSFSSNKEDRFLYEAKEKDLTGLYYYGARYYDSEMRRFTQPDTLLPDVYDPQQLNRYAFEVNNPVKYEDEEGHVAIIPFIIGYYIAAATITLVSTGIVTYDSYKNPEHRNQNVKELITTAVFAIATIPFDPSGVAALTISAGGSLLSAKGAYDRLKEEEEEEDTDEPPIIWIKKVDLSKENLKFISYQKVKFNELEKVLKDLSDSGWTYIPQDKDGGGDYYCIGSGCPNNSKSDEDREDETDQD